MTVVTTYYVQEYREELELPNDQQIIGPPNIYEPGFRLTPGVPNAQKFSHWPLSDLNQAMHLRSQIIIREKSRA